TGRTAEIQFFHGPAEKFRIGQREELLSATVTAGGFSLAQLHSRSGPRSSPSREFRHVGSFRNREVRGDAPFRKDKLITGLTQVDFDKVAQADLAGSDQIRYRIHQVTFNGTLQMTRAILQIRTFAQEELFCFGGAPEDELPVGLGSHDPVLNFV